MHLEEAQAKLREFANEKKQLQATLRGSMDEINKEITDLRCENRKLHGELARLQQQASTDQSSQNHEQTHQSLMRDSRLKKLHQFMAVDLERQVK